MGEGGEDDDPEGQCARREPEARLIQPGVLDVMNATNRRVGDLVESRRAEVEGPRVCAAGAAVSERHCYGLALVSNADFLAADRVLVGVDTVISRVAVKEGKRCSCNKVSVTVGDSTGTEPCAIEGAITANLCSGEEAGRLAATAAGSR